MPATPSDPQVVRFGEFVLHLRSGELAQNGTRVVLPDQLFRVLALFVRQSGALVTREELRHELWADDTFVDFEHGLNAAIKRLREALGDSAASPQFIETLPRRGYRFIAAVEEEPASDGASTAPAPTLRAEPVATVRDPRRRAPLRPGRLAVIGALIVACVASLRWGLRARAPDSHPRFTRLTWSGGLNTDPAISPDGALVAYASDAAGASNFDIWLQAIAGGDPLRITSDGADEVEPSFSLDGSRIVFSRRDKGLYTVAPMGGEPKQIVSEPWPRTPRFSPDGRWIAYWTGFPASVIAGGIPGAVGSIAIVRADGGAPREVATGLASVRYPVWTPDGERLLFLGEENAAANRFDWYLVRIDGSDLVKTGALPAIHAAGLRAGPPIPTAWSGEGVLFATNEADNSNVWRIPIAPDTGRLAGPAEPLTSGTAVERSPSVSASGRIVFASTVANVDVWRLPVDERTGTAAGALERITDSAASDRLRSVSADGRTLVFISSRTGRDEVWSKDLETNVERQVTERGAIDATLSPTGSSIVFARAEGNSTHLELVETRGGPPPTRLCGDCDITADWSPKGQAVLFGRGQPSRLFLYDLESARETELASHPRWNLHQARFSPDGRWVAFHTTNSPNVRQVYAAAMSGRTPVTFESWVPIVTDHGCHPNWSTDGSLVYHFSFRDGAFCPWVRRVDPSTKRPLGPPRPLLHLHDPRLRAASGAAATSDVQGGYFYFTATESTGHIWLLERRDR
jgi:Tol biopolymer transport system component/DNA-binding winged helix-turn-helix (wHTH) protein